MWSAWSIYTSDRTNVVTPTSPPYGAAQCPGGELAGLSQVQAPCPPSFCKRHLQPEETATSSGGSLLESEPSAKNADTRAAVVPTDVRSSCHAATKTVKKQRKLMATSSGGLLIESAPSAKKANNANKRAAEPTDVRSSRQPVTKTAKKQRKLMDDKTNSGQTRKRGLESQASWDRNFALLCAFRKRYGHFAVPSYFLAKSPVNLRKWMNDQIKLCAKLKPGKDEDAVITKDRIVRLNSISFDWSGLQDDKKSFQRDDKDWSGQQDGKNRSCHVDDTVPKTSNPWERNFELLCSVQRQLGHCRISGTFEVASVKLGIWASNQRRDYKKLTERGHSAITSEKIDRLDSIGFEWNFQEPWNQMFKHLRAFQREHKHFRVPATYVVYSFESGPLKVGPMKLGQWVIDQRTLYKKLLAKNEKLECSTRERYALLNSIGFFDYAGGKR